jgi:hypothetical protein
MEHNQTLETIQIITKTSPLKKIFGTCRLIGGVKHIEDWDQENEELVIGFENGGQFLGSYTVKPNKLDTDVSSKGDRFFIFVTYENMDLIICIAEDYPHHSESGTFTAKINF